MMYYARKRHKVLRAIMGGLIVVLLGCYVLVVRAPIREPQVWGVTFSHIYARSFGIAWAEVYEAILQDLGVRHLRIPVYWPEVEHRQGEWYFDDYDYMLSRADDVGAKVIVAIGRKVPRWPECHEAAWAHDMTDAEKDKLILNYLQMVVERYRGMDTIVAWQVENEPFLPFGICPPFHQEFLDQEIALVRSLDPSRPIVITDSGELSLWVPAMSRADIFGTTMYRTVYTERFGYVTYPLPPSFFRLKYALATLFTDKRQSVVIELQAEPWGPGAVQNFSRAEREKSFGDDDLSEMAAYASRTGFDMFYLWGVEFWYALKERGEPELWEDARVLFK
ncbi:MAG: cellulase family glycosylhydrolase [Patescibacteria group bacterium]